MHCTATPRPDLDVAREAREVLGGDRPDPADRQDRRSRCLQRHVRSAALPDGRVARLGRHLDCRGSHGRAWSRPRACGKRVKVRSTAASATALLSQSRAALAPAVPPPAGSRRPALLVVERGVGDILEEAQRQRTRPRSPVGTAACRPAPRRRPAAGPAARWSRRRSRRRHAARRPCGAGASSDSRAATRFSRASTFRVSGSRSCWRASTVQRTPSEVRLMLMRAPLPKRADLVAQVALDHLPHVLQAVFGRTNPRPRGWPGGSG